MMKHMRPTRLIPALLLGFALVALAPGQTARAQEQPLGGLDRYIEQAMDDWDVPGLALAVVKDDRVVLTKGYGVREVGEPAPVTEETLFLLASTTKAFTAAALGMLVDEDKLAWDDPVTQHLPSFQLQSPYVTRELTVRDLLTHRVGIARGDRLWWASPFDRDEVLRRARHLDPVSSFRSGYGYNNIMYIAAGEVVEAVSSMSWDQFIDQRIFQPIGMQASNTTIRELPEEGNVATPHARIDGAVEPIAWRNFDNLGGAGAINSNVLDMAQWLRLQLGEGVYEGRRLLDSATVEEMHAAQTVIQINDEYETLHPETNFRAYGLGWFLQDHRGYKVVQHSGSLDGMRARVGMIPEKNLGVVLLANMTESEMLEALLFRIFDAYLGVSPPQDWSARLLDVRKEDRAEAKARRDSVEAAQIEETSPSLPLEQYTGTYTNRAYGKATVAEGGDHLVLRRGPEFTGDLKHWHYETFRVTWRDPYMGKTFVTFALNAAGEVGAMEVKGLTDFKRASSQAALSSLGGAAHTRSMPDDSLETEIRTIIDRHPEAVVGVAVRDPSTGTVVNLNADRLFHAASTMKIPVLIEVFRQAEAGVLSLEDSLLVENRFSSIVDGSTYRIGDDSDEAIYEHVGEKMTVRALAGRMITVSSNLATNLLIARVTPEAVQQTLRRLGAERMHVRRGVEDLKAYRQGLNNTATAADLAALLAALMQGEAVGPEADQAIIDILMKQEFNEMIPAGLPKGARAAHKTGWITEIHHDAAIVYPERASPYVLVVLTEGIADENVSAALGAEIARAVHAHVRPNF